MPLFRYERVVLITHQVAAESMHTRARMEAGRVVRQKIPNQDFLRLHLVRPVHATEPVESKHMELHLGGVRASQHGEHPCPVNPIILHRTAGFGTFPG